MSGTSDLSRINRRVLNVIHANTNSVQGEWVSSGIIKQTLCAYAEYDSTDIEDALEELESEGLVVSDGGKEESYKKVDGVGRAKHPGEI